LSGLRREEVHKNFGCGHSRVKNSYCEAAKWQNDGQFQIGSPDQIISKAANQKWLQLTPERLKLYSSTPLS
jgi:hypothetical protein